MPNAAEYHSPNGKHRPQPESHGDLANRGDLTIEQQDYQQAKADDKKTDLEWRPISNQKMQVLLHPDKSRADFHRATQDELPNEQEGHQPSPFLASEPFAQINIRPARTGHRGAELAPDHSIRDGDQQGDDPAQHALRPA